MHTIALKLQQWIRILKCRPDVRVLGPEVHFPYRRQCAEWLAALVTGSGMFGARLASSEQGLFLSWVDLIVSLRMFKHGF